MNRNPLGNVSHARHAPFLARQRRWPRRLRLMFALLAGVAGCSEADFGESLLTPQRSTRATPSSTALPQAGLHVPADAPLTVADASRYSTGGSASASSAETTGVAQATASLERLGDGWGEFTLGHVLPAGRAAAQDVSVTVSLDVAYELLVPDGRATAALTGQVTLKVTVLDSQRRVIRRHVLADASDDDGSVRWSGRQQVEFDLTLAPDRAYHFIIAGRTQMTRETGSPTDESDGLAASAELKVLSSSIDIVPRG